LKDPKQGFPRGSETKANKCEYVQRNPEARSELYTLDTSQTAIPLFPWAHFFLFFTAADTEYYFYYSNTLFFTYFFEEPLLYMSTLIAGRDSFVAIATRYGLDGPGIESRRGRDFPHPTRPALGLTQLPLQWMLGFVHVGKVAVARRCSPTLT